MKKTLLILLLSFFIIGCSNNKVIETPNKTYPSWFLHTQNIEGDRLNGFGEGETKDEAIKKALSNLLESIQSNVQSSISISQESHKDYIEFIEKNVKKDINVSTNVVQINNYSISQIEQLAFDRIIVKISVDKNIFLNTFYEEYLSLKKRVKNSSTNTLNDFMEYKELLKEVEDFKNKSILLHTFKRVSLNDYFLLLNHLKNNFHKLQKNVQLRLKTSDNLNSFKTIVLSKIKDLDLNIVDTNSKYTIDISSEVNDLHFNGFFISNNILTFSILEDNKLIKTTQFEYKGFSSSNFKDAFVKSLQEIDISFKELI